jgi:NDP-sugar pyrophosphorylase family protein
MILAAGLGTRLRPLTNDRPKALVTVGDQTLLEIALARLRSFGVTEVIVNAHHFAELIVAYLEAHHNFGLRITVSHEPELLDTGGGLKLAAPFFLESTQTDPFIVHNVDVFSDLDLGRMIEFHRQQNALATLAVQQRTSSRQLLFDDVGQLCGRRVIASSKTGETKVEDDQWVRPVAHTQALAFTGIHVLSSRIFDKLKEQGAFSIISSYLRLAGEGEKIVAYRADACNWRDLGRPESILAATEEMANGMYHELL